jgi:hypothetical protein
MGQFPKLPVGGPLSEVETVALRSMSQACGDLRHELQSARALMGRLHSLVDTAETYAGDGERFRFHEEAVRGASGAASRYEHDLAVTCWRWASASTVLGMTVLERVVSGAPPLAPEAVELLSAEPTLDELQRVIELPVERLLAARDADSRATAKNQQERLVRQMEVVRSDVADRQQITPEQAGDLKLSPLERQGEDLLNEPLLDPLFSQAEQAPFQIAWHIARSRAT